jgi:hypothetical protein
MKIEQSRVKIIISKKEYDALMAAREVIGEMKQHLYDEDLGGLSFYQELLCLEDSFDTFDYSFEETKYGDYFMEVD